MLRFKKYEDRCNFVKGVFEIYTVARPYTPKYVDAVITFLESVEQHRSRSGSDIKLTVQQWAFCQDMIYIPGITPLIAFERFSARFRIR